MRINSFTALATVLLSTVTMTQAQSNLPLPKWMQADTAVPQAMPDLQRFASAVLPTGQYAAPAPRSGPSSPVLPNALPSEQPPSMIVPAVLPTQAVQPATSSPAPLGSNPFRTEVPAAAAAAPVAVDAFSLGGEQPSPAAASVATTSVDMRALRYYAAQRNLQRVSAETRRLKAEHPGWEPPADLFAPATVAVDEQPLWDLLAAGNYGEMRRRMAVQQEQAPDWHPSDEMNRKLGEEEGRSKIAAAARYGRWSEVVDRARTSPELLVCANLDILWSVAEALARTGNMADSFELYRYAITNCGTDSERVASVQKAADQLPANGKDALIEIASAVSSAPEPFESLRFDSLRAQLGAVAAGEDATPVANEDLERFSTFIQADRSASDAGLMGWYFYALEEHRAASAWFQAGMQIQSDPKLVEGSVLALRGESRTEEARDLAYRFRDMAPEVAKLYIEIVAEKLTGAGEESDPLDDLAEERPAREGASAGMSGEELRRFAQVVLDEESALGAQALGWRFVERANLKAAEEWFTRSVGWEDNEGGIIGTAVVAARLKQNARLQSIKAKYQAHYPELAEFRVGASVKPPRAKQVKRARPVRQVSRKASRAAPVVANKKADFWNSIEFK
jgi:cellulose synthase operon protein C